MQNLAKRKTTFLRDIHLLVHVSLQARNQDFMRGGGGGGEGANEALVDQTTEMYFLLSDPFI